jgi:ABC-type amino acid transport substrate-binding protein
MGVVCIASQVWGQPIDRTKNDFMKIDSHSLTKNRVIIGADINYPPYSFLDKQGRPQGHDIEIMNKLAAMLKIQVEYKLKPWSEALQDLKDGTVDALTGIIYLDERKQFYDFTIPVWFESYAIFASREARFEDLDDLYRGRIIALKGDASISRFINPMGLTERTMFVDTLPDAIRSVEEGENDFVLAPYSLGMDVIDNSDYRNIRIVGSPVLPSLYCIAVRKGNSELLEVLNKGIDALKSEGTIQRINEKWFIQRQKEISLAGVFKILGAVLVPIVVILATLFIWSWSLRRQVCRKTSQLEVTNEKLTKALAEVKQLSGFLPICASCKKIRDDKGYWNQIESYISQHSEAEFSHSICPECAKKLYPELYGNPSENAELEMDWAKPCRF